MTNEEKAMELFPTVHTLECMCKGVREKLVAMAEWKDQQFKEYLEKKYISVKDRYMSDFYEANARDFGMSIVDEIINEFFNNK